MRQSQRHSSTFNSYPVELSNLDFFFFRLLLNRTKVTLKFAVQAATIYISEVAIEVC